MGESMTTIIPQAMRDEQGELPVRWEDVIMATYRLKEHLPTTPMQKSSMFRQDFNLFWKLELRLDTGSFKERGALNTLLGLTPEQKKIGVIAASAGNHALALAYHGKRLGIPVTVVMPTIAPINKSSRCSDEYGAKVIFYGNNIQDAREEAYRLMKDTHQFYVNGYDNPMVLAGAGSCGVEILEQVPHADVVIIPTGGGGLLAGVSLAIKKRNPNCKVIGIESANCPSTTAAIAAGKPVLTPSKGSLADGIAVPLVGENAFRIVQRHVDKIVTIPERLIALATLKFLECEKMMVEGAAATVLAALLSGQIDDDVRGKNVVAIVTGGNIDITVLGRVIERGLYSDGRMIQFDAAITDRPGGLANFTGLVAEMGASIKEIVQERPFINDVNVCSVHCTVEIRSREHGQQLVAHLRKNNVVVKMIDDKKWEEFDGGINRKTPPPVNLAIGNVSQSRL